jgi:hypothetical protein
VISSNSLLSITIVRGAKNTPFAKLFSLNAPHASNFSTKTKLTKDAVIFSKGSVLRFLHPERQEGEGISPGLSNVRKPSGFAGGYSLKSSA